MHADVTKSGAVTSGRRGGGGGGVNLFNATVDLVVNLEGGHSLDPADTGNWTGGAKGKGELKGTKFGISAAAYPDLDIANLTKEQAKEIYYKDYWLRAGCDELPPQLAVVVVDCAINSGVGLAKKLLKESSNTLDFIARRYEHYASLEQFNLYGRGWVRRFSSIVKHAATLGDEKPELLIVLDEHNTEVYRHKLPSNGRVILNAGNDKTYIRVAKELE